MKVRIWQRFVQHEGAGEWLYFVGGNCFHRDIAKAVTLTLSEAEQVAAEWGGEVVPN